MADRGEIKRRPHNFVDYTGRAINNLEVINIDESDKWGYSRWSCICVDCGKKHNLPSSSLKRGKIKCLCPLYVGYTSGRLTIIQMSEKGKGVHKKWKCECSCGKLKEVREDALRAGTIQSCGCLLAEATGDRFRKHGKSGDITYISWKAMVYRCDTCKKDTCKTYIDITVCDRWLNSFENFYEDMGDRPSLDYSIDRVDTFGNYEPTNCRWANWHQQAINRTTNNMEYTGVYGTPGGKFKGTITKKGITYYLGTFDTAEQAAKAYDDKCEELWGDRPNGF